MVIKIVLFPSETICDTVTYVVPDLNNSIMNSTQWRQDQSRKQFIYLRDLHSKKIFFSIFEMKHYEQQNTNKNQ